MIVVDVNVVAYFVIGGPKAEAAEAALRRDPIWVAPRLWRSEFRNILATCLRQRQITLEKARDFMEVAETLLGRETPEVRSDDVLRLAAASRCTAYDCEYVALAGHLGVPLVTADMQILRAFPDSTIPLEEFARGA